MSVVGLSGTKYTSRALQTLLALPRSTLQVSTCDTFSYVCVCILVSRFPMLVKAMREVPAGSMYPPPRVTFSYSCQLCGHAGCFFLFSFNFRAWECQGTGSKRRDTETEREWEVFIGINSKKSPFKLQQVWTGSNCPELEAFFFCLRTSL